MLSILGERERPHWLWLTLTDHMIHITVLQSCKKVEYKEANRNTRSYYLILVYISIRAYYALSEITRTHLRPRGDRSIVNARLADVQLIRYNVRLSLPQQVLAL